MSEQEQPARELTHELEFIELPQVAIKEQLLRLFNNQIQRDYVVADFTHLDGNVVIKLKRRSPLR